MAWQHGAFYLEPEEGIEPPHRIELSTEAALMEGMRILDEVNRLELPPLRSPVRVNAPLRAPLRSLSPDELEVFQTAMHQPQLDSVLNNCPLDDITIAKALRKLLDEGYLETLPLE
jgi:hypothetical protein